MAADLRAGQVAADTEALKQRSTVPLRRVAPHRRHGRPLWRRERSILKHDPRGETSYVVTRVDKLSEGAEHPLERLSRREREALEHVVAGRPSKEIAARLGISASSVDTYRSRLMFKLAVENQTQLVRFALRNGIAGA